MKPDDLIVRLENCPDCDGRGWFLINPFATGGSNGAGGIGNMTACKTCVAAKKYWDEHGTLPPDVVERIEAKRMKAGEIFGRQLKSSSS